MDTHITVQTSGSSSILAYGTASHWKQRAVAGGIAAACLAVAGFFSAWYALTRPVVLPRDSAFLFALTPSAASQAAPPRLTEHFPAIWREALGGSSDWTVLLGAYETHDGWKSFVLVPRWRARGITGFRTENALVTLITEAPFEPGERSIRYTDTRRWGRGIVDPALRFWIDPKRLLNGSPAEGPGSDDPVTGAYREGSLLTDSAFTGAPSHAVKRADLSLSLSAEPAVTPILGALFDELPHGGLAMSKLDPRPTSLHLNLENAGGGPTLELEFADSIQKPLAETLLASFGIVQTRQTQLPDGTIVTEQTQPRVEGEPPYRLSLPTKNYGNLVLDNQRLRIGEMITEPAVLPAGCALESISMRISGSLIGLILKSYTEQFSSESLPSVVMGAKQGKLGACFE